MQPPATDEVARVRADKTTKRDMLLPPLARRRCVQSLRQASTGPIAAYNALVDAGKIKRDSHQLNALVVRCSGSTRKLPRRATRLHRDKPRKTMRKHRTVS